MILGFETLTVTRRSFDSRELTVRMRALWWAEGCSCVHPPFSLEDHQETRHGARRLRERVEHGVQCTHCFHALWQ